MYPNGTKKIIVRAPESNDEAIRKEQSTGSDDEKPAPALKSVKSPEPEIKKEEIIQVIEAKEDVDVEVENSSDESSSTPTKKSSALGYHSDNVNMIMDLFEGKFIE